MLINIHSQYFLLIAIFFLQHETPRETPVRRRNTKAEVNQTELLQYMRERDERAAILRREELEIERLKATNQAKQIDIMSQMLRNPDK